jgi:dTDP-alpha-D-glucuronic acid decarboxylase
VLHLVEDAVDATLRVAASAAADGQSFNVGSDRETSVADADRFVTRLVGSNLEPFVLETSATLGEAHEDIPCRVPDTAKVNRGARLEVRDQPA